MNARALRILGQLADAANDEPAAAKLIRRRPVTAGECRRLLLMRESFERQDFATAVQHADVLLRTRPQVALLVAPTLARIAEDNSASPELMAHARDQSAMASGILLHADAQHHGCAHAA